jgi:hypothetical protein
VKSSLRPRSNNGLGRQNKSTFAKSQMQRIAESPKANLRRSDGRWREWHFFGSSRRNKKFSTMMLVHEAQCHLKTNPNTALVKLMLRCSMWPGVVIPLISTRGTTPNSCKEHRRMSFFAKAPKAEILSLN